MARTKSKRDLKFKPRFKYFSPPGGTSENINLLHEEIEAVYLMDYQGLYQEDAALSMGVSRPTFSRIIKNARTKIATALINGKGLTIRDDKNEFIIAFICNETENYGDLSIEMKYIIVVKLFENEVVGVKVVANPLHETNLRPSHVLPKILAYENCNYFIANKIGEGLKNSLSTKGIFMIEKEAITPDEVRNISKIIL